jgi:hypothetical protein
MTYSNPPADPMPARTAVPWARKQLRRADLGPNARDRAQAILEYWTTGPRTVPPPVCGGCDTHLHRSGRLWLAVAGENRAWCADGARHDPGRCLQSSVALAG